MGGTNQFVTMISSFATVVQYIIRGQLMFAYAGWFALVSSLAAFSGLKAINFYLKKSGRQSVITIILAVLLASSIATLPLNFILKGWNL